MRHDLNLSEPMFGLSGEEVEKILGNDAVEFREQSVEKSKDRKVVKNLRVINIRDFLSMEFPAKESILSPWLNTQGLAMIHGIRGLGKTSL